MNTQLDFHPAVLFLGGAVGAFGVGGGIYLAVVDTGPMCWRGAEAS